MARALGIGAAAASDLVHCYPGKVDDLSLAVHDPNERVLGVDRVLDTDVEGRPKQVKRARRPYAFGTLDAILKHRARCQAIAAMYELCSERYRRGERVTEWPPGTYAPGLSVAA